MSEKKPDWDMLREAARLICCSAFAAHKATLRGDVPFDSSANFKASVGQMVMEYSSFHRAFDPRYGYDWLNMVGILDRIAREPVFSEKEWAEAASPGEAMPLENVYYIRTLDGREFRWVNCDFIRVPDSPDFKVMNDAVKRSA